MMFVYRKWEEFCSHLASAGYISIPACEISKDMQNYLVLKHDVETDVSHAYKIAQIENKHGHRGSYYVQAYLLDDKRNIEMLSEMQNMGHEISYHYDVLDSCKGNIDKAIDEFDKNILLFTTCGFDIKTLCQHGNPVIERNGYHSNRDFFRNERVKARYPEIYDIMVNFKEQIPTDYLYFSDAGQKFKLIYDPINNDVVNSDDKNIPYKNLNELMTALSDKKGNIISMHPHRWIDSALLFLLKKSLFKGIKLVVKVLRKIPLFNKIMSRYYYLAKKI